MDNTKYDPSEVVIMESDTDNNPPKVSIYPIKPVFLFSGEIMQLELNSLTPEESQKMLDKNENNIIVFNDVLQEVRAGEWDDSHPVGFLFQGISLAEEQDKYVLIAQVLERVHVQEISFEQGHASATYVEYPWTSHSCSEERRRKKAVVDIIDCLNDIQDIELRYSYGEKKVRGWRLEGFDFDFSEHCDEKDNYKILMKLMQEVVAKFPFDSSILYGLISATNELMCSDLILRYLKKWKREKQELFVQIDKRYGALMSDYKKKDQLENLKRHLKNQILCLEDEVDDLNHHSVQQPGSSSNLKDKTYAQQIEEHYMPEAIRVAATHELEKLSRLSKDTTEYYKICEYLDLILSLPWEKEEPIELDIVEAERILEESHYGLKKVKERILQHLAVQKLKKGKNGSVLLLIGNPGVGKTSVASSIAKAMGRKYTRLSLGGVSDEHDIRGFHRTYTGSKPGRVLESIRKVGVSNPVIVLDEIDKLTSFRGDPSAALLEVLDPEQNATFTDHFLDLHYDLSDVFFIATANDWHNIPSALRDRMEVVEVNSYTSDEKFHIATEHIYEKTLDAHGLSKKQLQITDDAVRSIINDYTFESGVRDLQRKFAEISRVASAKIVSGNPTLPLRIKESDLEEILGQKIVRHNFIQSANPSGVVTGLSMSQVGGGMMLIEAVKMPGTGELILTGQLGDVMKESALICLSLLKSRLPLNTVNFKELGLHIHFPEGAIPKEGPSAGIALFTALASLISGKEVESTLAMTGEITLRGAVLPVGGIKEKLLGAIRSGITKVLIPKANESDLKELPPEVRHQLNIMTVETIEEVVQEALNITLS